MLGARLAKDCRANALPFRSLHTGGCRRRHDLACGASAGPVGIFHGATRSPSWSHRGTGGRFFSSKDGSRTVPRLLARLRCCVA